MCMCDRIYYNYCPQQVVNISFKTATVIISVSSEAAENQHEEGLDYEFIAYRQLHTVHVCSPLQLTCIIQNVSTEHYLADQ